MDFFSPLTTNLKLHIQQNAVKGEAKFGSKANESKYVLSKDLLVWAERFPKTCRDKERPLEKLGYLYF